MGGWPEEAVEKGSGPTLKPGVPDINIAFRLFCLGKMNCIVCQIENAWCFPQMWTWSILPSADVGMSGL